MTQPGAQVGRHRDECVDERREQPPEHVVLAMPAAHFNAVAAVLGVDAKRHPGQPGGQAIFDRADVVSVQHGGTQPAQQRPQCPVRREALPRLLVERMELDVRPVHEIGIGRMASQANHRVPVVLRRHAVDALRQQRLQPADLEAVQHMNDERDR
jgi:hypothetical protein